MKITLPNGTTVEGSTKEVAEVVKQLGYSMPEGAGDEQWYYSRSKGEYIAISTMALPHLKNALLKLYREWVEGLSSYTDMKTLCMVLSNGPDDPVFTALVKQLAKKVAESER